jgi:hypothetical protein
MYHILSSFKDQALSNKWDYSQGVMDHIRTPPPLQGFFTSLALLPVCHTPHSHAASFAPPYAVKILTDVCMGIFVVCIIVPYTP